MRAISVVPTSVLILGVLATGALSLGETRLLIHLQSGDPVNTLRLSNQLFSIAVVLLLSRMRVAVWPRFVDVRRQMFGVYLAQTLVTGLLTDGMKWLLPRTPEGMHLRSSMSFVAVWLMSIAVTFLICILVSRLACEAPVSGLVGGRPLHAQGRAARGGDDPGEGSGRCAVWREGRSRRRWSLWVRLRWLKAN